MNRNFVDRQVMGEKIQEACKKKGISVVELAKRIDKPAMHVFRISVGAAYCPKLETLADICRELDITMDYLLGIDDEQEV